MGRINTDEFVNSHGKRPRGRGNWCIKTIPEITLEDCHRQYGQAHEAHMAANSECPWCGAAEFWFMSTPYSEAERLAERRLGPGPWYLQP
jgi:hypothetical protein